MTMVSTSAVSASVCGGAHDMLTEQSELERTVRLVGWLDGSVNERERERVNIHRVRQKVCVGIVPESPTAQALSWQKKKRKSLYLSLTP